MAAMVALAGIGVIAPKISGLADIARACAGLQPAFQKEIGNIPPPEGMKPRDMRRMAHLTRAVLYAADRAVTDAGLKGHNGGIFIGLLHGIASNLRVFHDDLFEYGPELASPNTFSNGITNAPLSAVSRHLGLTEGGVTLVGTETCGLDALGHAADALETGRFNLCCAGGAEEYCPVVDEVYARLGWFNGAAPPVLPWVASCRRERRGVPVSEAAVFFCMTTPSYAARHGAGTRCFYTPIDNVYDYDGPAGCIISCAGGGPADCFEMDLLERIVSKRRKKPGILFSKCFFGETFAAAPLLSAAMAWDILSNGTRVYGYPVHGRLCGDGNNSIDFTSVSSVLVTASGRDGTRCGGLFTRETTFN